MASCGSRRSATRERPDEAWATLCSAPTRPVDLSPEEIRKRAHLLPVLDPAHRHPRAQSKEVHREGARRAARVAGRLRRRSPAASPAPATTTAATERGSDRQRRRPRRQPSPKATWRRRSWSSAANSAASVPSVSWKERSRTRSWWLTHPDERKVEDRPSDGQRPPKRNARRVLSWVAPYVVAALVITFILQRHTPSGHSARDGQGQRTAAGSHRPRHVRDVALVRGRRGPGGARRPAGRCSPRILCHRSRKSRQRAHAHRALRVGTGSLRHLDRWQELGSTWDEPAACSSTSSPRSCARCACTPASSSPSSAQPCPRRCYRPCSALPLP